MTDAPHTSEKQRAFRDLSTVWRDRGIDPALATEASGTLEASDRRLASRGLVSDAGDDPDARFFDEPLTLGELLGRGGMGEVRDCLQHALRRRVAIKQTYEDASDSERAALLKEAWVGALVEHPNVVPVHTLVRVGATVGLVMKRIVGESWTKLLVPPNAVDEASFDRYLVRHLRIFVRVCHAVAFAHSRGVLHLDLKPDNVMVAEDDEVYVLDWGLAAGIEGAAPPWLGRASEIRHVAGTPGYMAPELAAVDTEAIGIRTDVYLLGAVLHHVLSGGELHVGESIVELLGSAYLSAPPVYGGEIAEELGQIVARATHADPARRFASAVELREAVEAHLRHRPAERLVASVLRGLATVEEWFASGEDDDARLEPAIAECEIGLEEARRAWPMHPKLKELEKAITSARIEHASRTVRPTMARHRFERILAAARMSDPELVTRVQALGVRVAAREREVQALEELRHELDFSHGARPRSRLWLVLGTFWAALSFAYHGAVASGALQIGYGMLLGQGALMFGVLLPAAWSVRSTHLSNRANRRVYGALVLCAVAVELLWVASALVDAPVSTAIAITTLFYLFVFLSLAIVIDRRMSIAAVAFAGAALACALAPAYVHVALGVAGFVAGASATFVPEKSGPA